MQKIYFIIVATIFVCSSCKKSKDEVEPYKGKDYFPVNIGHEVVYDVRLITYDNFTGIWDTAAYQIKEITDSTFKDSQNRETQRIVRYIDNDTTAGFIPYKVWTANLTTSTGQREEDNIRYIKLNFPQNLNMTWDGNSLNTLRLQYYKYISLHAPLTLNGIPYDSTCTVLQQKDSDLTKNYFSEEKYATNVGMIYKINQKILYDSIGAVHSASIYTETTASFKK
jgi:hypothetical protein